MTKEQRQELIRSFRDILVNVTALDVKTMIVSEIPLKPFIPWQVYSQIYLISPEYLAQQQVDVSRRDRYLELRHHLAFLREKPDA